MGRHHRSDLGVALLGSLSGAVLAGSLGLAGSAWYVRQFMGHGLFAGAIQLFFGSVGGAWLGAVLGCWVALRWRRAQAAAATARMLAMGFPAAIVGWIGLSLVIRSRFTTFWATDGRVLAAVGTWVLASLFLGGVTLLARWRALRDLRNSDAL